MRNLELVNKRFDQLFGKLKNIKYGVNMGNKIIDINNEITSTEELLNDLRDLIDRETSPLRNG